MTNKQTIEVLSEIRSGYNCFDASEKPFYEALSEAIEALQLDSNSTKVDNENVDLVSRQDAIDALKICDNNEDGINCYKCPLRDERWDGAWYDEETNCYTKLMRDSAKLLEMPSTQPDLNTSLYSDGFVDGYKQGQKDAQPERKKGEWIRITQGAMPEQYICPYCHRTVESHGVEELLSIRYPYCHCGADMRGDNND